MTIEQAFAQRDVTFPDTGLTPSGFAALYGACPVVLEDGQVGHVRVHKYRINRAAPGSIDTSHRIRDSEADAERNVVGPLIRRWCRANGDLGRRVQTLLYQGRKLNQVFFGKGAPRDIGFVLAVLREVGRIGALYPNHRELAALQAYCDSFIGVDCSGLVNNYFITKGHFSDTNANCQTTIRTYGRLDRRLDFLPGRPREFILVWKSMGHIAIIDRWERAEDKLRVIESSASLGGVRDTVYDIDPDMPDLSKAPSQRYWQVFRTAQNNSRQKVYMVSPMPAA